MKQSFHSASSCIYTLYKALCLLTHFSGPLRATEKSCCAKLLREDCDCIFLRAVCKDAQDGFCFPIVSGRETAENRLTKRQPLGFVGFIVTFTSHSYRVEEFESRGLQGILQFQ